MSLPMCEVTFVPDWKDPRYDDPPRRGYVVTCPKCGPLGNPPGWAYAKDSIACGVATRHERSRRHVGV